MRAALEYENSSGTALGACTAMRLASTVVRSMRGGVPVFRRRVGNPSARSAWASPIAGASPKRPSACTTSPRNVLPPRNVPVASTTRRAKYSLPSAATTPRIGAVLNDQIVDQTADDREVRLRAQLLDRAARVRGLVHQLAQRAHRRAFAFVEKARVQAGCDRRCGPSRRRARRSRARAGLSRFRRSTDCTAACRSSPDRR